MRAAYTAHYFPMRRPSVSHALHTKDGHSAAGLHPPRSPAPAPLRGNDRMGVVGGAGGLRDARCLPACAIHDRSARHEDVSRALLESGIDPALLELELTESSLMQNTEATISTRLALKSRGVQLSIDDFGTGYSSLAYLQRFPIDKVKIDIAFVRNITGEFEQSTIAQTIIQMAHNWNTFAIMVVTKCRDISLAVRYR